MGYLQKPWLKFYDPRINENVSVEYDSLFDLLKQAANIHNQAGTYIFRQVMELQRNKDDF
jgi:long-chain acyl-CoA synthetase